MELSNWDHRFLYLAAVIGGWSKDPSTKVGAVIVDAKNRIVGSGYNGLPRGVDDNPEILQSRELKYKVIVHAELNAILNSVVDLEGCTLYVRPLPICGQCASAVIQSGIKRVVCHAPTNPRWKESHELGASLLREAGVEVQHYILPEDV